MPDRHQPRGAAWSLLVPEIMLGVQLKINRENLIALSSF